MKKMFVTLIVLLLSVQLPAGNVSPEKARAVASSILLSNTTRSDSSDGLTLVWDGSVTRSNSDSPFYVFCREGGGFAIISGDDAAAPVLGYSETGSFNPDALPSNLKGWLQGFSEEMTLLRENGVRASSSIEALWQSAAEGGTRAGTEKNLKTARWGQGSPYNAFCPIVDNLQSVTGCVSTAMAEIMRYHKWPEGASGRVPSYSYPSDFKTEINIPEHQLSSSYDWDNMPEAFFGENGKLSGVTESQCNEVAKLMFDLGTMLQSRYNSSDPEAGTSGTGAFSEDIAPSLVKYLGYDSTAVSRFREMMTYREWSAMLKGEIDEGRPLFYSGHNTSGEGHQFVIDGYKDGELFHINWGWDGDCNGWFRLQAMDPDNPDNPDMKSAFSNSQVAIVGISPAKGKLNHPQTSLGFYYSPKGNLQGGLKVTDGSLTPGKTVKIGAGCIMNLNTGSGFIDEIATSMGSAVMDLAIGLMDSRGNITKIYDRSSESLPSGYYWQIVNFRFNMDETPLKYGERLVCCYKDASSRDWTCIRTDPFSAPVVEELSPYDFPAIYVNADGYRSGEELDLRIVGTSLLSNVKWYFDGNLLDAKTRSVLLTPGTHAVKAIVDLIGSNGAVTRTEALTRVISVD